MVPSPPVCAILPNRRAWVATCDYIIIAQYSIKQGVTETIQFTEPNCQQQIPSFHTYHWFCFTIIMKAPAIHVFCLPPQPTPYPNTESVYTPLITKWLPTISVSSSSKASAISCNSSTSSSSSSSSSPSSSSSYSGLSSGCYTNEWNHRLKKVSMLLFSG